MTELHSLLRPSTKKRLLDYLKGESETESPVTFYDHADYTANSASSELSKSDGD